jgi:organic hydroperoxide reductase OsmC/OhrA
VQPVAGQNFGCGRRVTVAAYDGAMSHDAHQYEAHLTWSGRGINDYTTYSRSHRLSIAGKPDLGLTADPAFRGDAAAHNPEDLFVAAISSCHMLSYLALCAKYKIDVLAYQDRAAGTMQEDGKGGGRFVEVVLHPVVTIADASKREQAEKLHVRAHEQCFIANSCSVPIRHEAVVRT